VAAVGRVQQGVDAELPRLGLPGQADEEVVAAQPGAGHDRPPLAVRVQTVDRTCSGQGLDDVQLRELEAASLALERDEDNTAAQGDDWLRMLIAPGGSLGGARPKASVVDPDGHLWIAKFPSVSDEHDVGAWELVVQTLARGCRLQVAEGLARRFANPHHTFIFETSSGAVIDGGRRGNAAQDGVDESLRLRGREGDGRAHRGMRRGAGAGGRGGQPVAVGSVLDRILSGLKIEERVVTAAATDLWPEVVGPEVARRTHAVGVREGELLVEVQGAVWMGHLAVLRHGILDDVNGRLPAEARLRGIRLVPMRGKEGSRS